MAAFAGSLGKTEVRMIARILVAATLLFGVASSAPAEAAGKVGVVLMHGKLGMALGAAPAGRPAIGARLVAALEGAGYLVATPEMCWSRRRSYDHGFSDCLGEIDAAIAGLKGRGATSIVVGGLSLGGNAAIAYGATHPGLLGIVALGPADDPNLKARRPEIAGSLAKARDLAAQGKGDAATSFDDVNTGPSGSYGMTLETTPRTYLSFYAPDSSAGNAPASIPANVARLSAPLLWVAGSSDPTQNGGRGFAFDKAPRNALNRYVTVAANHIETPDAGAAEVLAWLKDVAAPQ
jgi:pimeloyl-ACP methyl ester carboxylesterase